MKERKNFCLDEGLWDEYESLLNEVGVNSVSGRLNLLVKKDISRIQACIKELLKYD